MTSEKDELEEKKKAGFLPVLFGVFLFFTVQYAFALKRLGSGSGSMKNKFSALAQDKYLDFLILQNLYVIVGYVILAVLFTLLLLPLVDRVVRENTTRPRILRVALAFAGSFLVHSFFTLRLVKTRPYFLDDANFGYWYYEVLNIVPESAKPFVFYTLFNVLPLVVIAWAVFWYFRKLSRKGRIVSIAVMPCVGAFFIWKLGVVGVAHSEVRQSDGGKRWNVIIIGSDSLRGRQAGLQRVSASTQRRTGCGRCLAKHRQACRAFDQSEKLLHTDRIDARVWNIADEFAVSAYSWISPNVSE